ncbi:ABC transporter permease [Streptomyces sp. NPDC048483]|uniref:ABC transporter permease n=1 Tax=Streptomyces sp. NPDC048483 TaxID=3154927 RepID=UPI003443D3F3
MVTWAARCRAAALWATYTRRSWLRQVLLAAPAVAVSLPPFWVGLVLVQVVCFQWGLLPAIGDGGVRGLLLPALTLALPCAAMLAQVLARGLVQALDEPYIRTAHAKGVTAVRIHLHHALPRASLPALALTGVLAGNTLASATVVETVFSRPGVGRLVVSAVHYQDMPVVQGVVLLGSTVFVLGSLLVDLLHHLIDRRLTTTSYGWAARRG